MKNQTRWAGFLVRALRLLGLASFSSGTVLFDSEVSGGRVLFESGARYRLGYLSDLPFEELEVALKKEGLSDDQIQEVNSFLRSIES